MIEASTVELNQNILDFYLVLRISRILEITFWRLEPIL